MKNDRLNASSVSDSINKSKNKDTSLENKSISVNSKTLQVNIFYLSIYVAPLSYKCKKEISRN